MALDKIKDNVWIGSQDNIKEWLRSEYNDTDKIAILSVLDRYSYIPLGKWYPNIVQKFVDLRDDSGVKFKAAIPQLVKFIESNKKAERIFVHCFKGKNRSSSTIIAWLMLKKNMSYIKALSFIESKHHETHP